MKLAILALVLVANTRGQDLLLLLPHGVVLDHSGKPIEGARVDHTGQPIYSVETGKNGEFSLKDHPTAFVVRKGGYQSQLVHPPQLGKTDELRITLQPSTYGPGFPRCSSTQKYDGLTDGSFKFAKQSDIKTDKPGRDVDYQARSYSSGKASITHGAGPSWSWGLPRDRDVWDSIDYSEIVRWKEVLLPSGPSSSLVIDARGENRDGTRWRYLGHFEESASYHDVKPADAVALDRFMDGWCTDR